VLRTDNGREFTVEEFADYCANEGIMRHYSAPNSPQQNGVVERRNQTVVGMARALLKQRGMPTKFWGEAVVTAIHLLNKSSTKSLQGKTPYEAWYGRTPAVVHLRVFGCLCFAKELNQVRKLDDRNRPGVFLGYADGAKAYHVYDPVSQHVLVSRDVVFDETRGWDWNSSAEHAASMAEDGHHWSFRRSGHAFTNDGHHSYRAMLTSSGGAWRRCIGGWCIDSALLYFDTARLALPCFGAIPCSGDSSGGRAGPG